MVSVTHAIPKTLGPSQADADLGPSLSLIVERMSPADQARWEQAWHWAETVYGQQRLALTDEPILSHALATVAILGELKLDTDSALAALFFAFPECLPDWAAAIEQRFGAQVVQLVQGVERVKPIPRLIHLTHSRDEDQQAQTERVRKMLLAMVEDIRVVLIKLAWRTQTMHYLATCPAEVAQGIARETMDVFAPLANRLGIWHLKWELEDLSFRHLEPDLYKKIAKLLDERRLDRQHYIEQVLATLNAHMQEAGIEAEVTGRAKHIYSIYRKMKKKHLDFSELYDVRAVRVLVPKLSDCYTVLGIIHHIWKPIPGEFDDYISHPKGNFYQSLHTAVIGPEDKAVEVQIRTHDMHRHAELGVAAHWRYKEGGSADQDYQKKIAWLRQLLTWKEQVSPAPSLAETFQAELFADTVYVLSPQGKVVALPQGATPLDFAYHIHTDLGHRCRGAKVDGQIVPLSHELKNGERVEILTAKEGGPSLDWLHQGLIKSPRAQAKVRAWMRAQQNAEAEAQGRDCLDKELQRLGQTALAHDHLAVALGLERATALYTAIAHGDITPRQIAGAVQKLHAPAPAEAEPEFIALRASQSQRAGQGVLIEGVDKLMTSLAGCCHPIPPDPVMGFVTRGRGISIHRSQCSALKHLAQTHPERLINAEWGALKMQRFAVGVCVVARDRQGLLRDISDAFARQKVNVTAAQSQSHHGRAEMRFTVEVPHSDVLTTMMQQLRLINGVEDASRI